MAEISCRSSTDISKESPGFTPKLSSPRLKLMNGCLDRSGSEYCQIVEEKKEKALTNSSMLDRIQEAKLNNEKYQLIIEEHKEEKPQKQQLESTIKHVQILSE